MVGWVGWLVAGLVCGWCEGGLMGFLGKDGFFGKGWVRFFVR